MAERTAGVVRQLRAAGCVFAEQEAQLLQEAASSSDELADLVRRRVAGLPLEHLLGWAQFCGLRIRVGEGVFVPRRRTELLVRVAVDLAPVHPVVVDLCCGSGAVGVAIAAALPGTELHLADLDPAAVAWAGRNAPPGARVTRGDLYEALPGSLRGRVDLLVANAPYVPTGSLALMPVEARLHEPAPALDGGADGLDVQRRLIAGAGGWLAPGGHLLVETSERQCAGTLELLRLAGLPGETVHDADLDATVVRGAAER